MHKVFGWMKWWNDAWHFFNKKTLDHFEKTYYEFEDNRK